MAFPTLATTPPLMEALRHAMTLAADVKRESTTLRDAALTTGITWQQAMDYHGSLNSYRLLLEQRAAVPGLAAYAQEQFAQPALNIVQEYNNMHAEIVATLDWAEANIPLSSVGSFVDHSFVPATYAPGGLAALVTQLTQLIATIE